MKIAENWEEPFLYLVVYYKHQPVILGFLFLIVYFLGVSFKIFDLIFCIFFIKQQLKLLDREIWFVFVTSLLFHLSGHIDEMHNLSIV